MKRNVFAILVVISLFVLTSCNTNPRIKIGVLVTLSGSFSNYGLSAKDGINMAVEEINKSGGINGRQLQVYLRDDKNDPDYAVKMFEELVDEGVSVVLGPVSSTIADALYDISQQEKMVLLAPGVSNISVIEANEYLFSLAAESQDGQKKMVDYILNHDKVHHLCLIIQEGNDVYNLTWEKSFVDIFEAADGQILNRITINLVEDNLYDVIEQGLPADTEGVMIIGSAQGAAAVSQQLAKIDDQLKKYSRNWTMENFLIELGGDSVEGIVMPSMWNQNSTREAYLEFKKNFTERYSREPSFSEQCSYELLILLEKVFDKIKTYDSENIREALIQIRSFEGLQERLVSNDKGSFFKHIELFRVKAGQFTLVDFE